MSASRSCMYRSLVMKAMTIHAEKFSLLYRHKSVTMTKLLNGLRHFSSTNSSSQISDVSFREMSLSEPTLKALNHIFKFEKMTKVQEAIIPVIRKGDDVIAKARTGSGKTLAFLIPCVERLVSHAAATGQRRKGTSVLVLSPTRELAQQIFAETESLLTFHKKYLGLRAGLMYGGTDMMQEKQLVSKQPPADILIATPGRLLDHLENTQIVLDQLSQGLEVCVLDEADQLLDAFFRPTVEAILARIPRERQTLLFSATMPKEVQRIAAGALASVRHTYLDTVGVDQDINMQVKQTLSWVSWDRQFAYLHTILQEEMQKNPQNYRVIVFFPTSFMTSYFTALMTKAGLNILEINGLKTQHARTFVSQKFRTVQKGFLFTSDVSARGIDYPDLTLVLQMGVPHSRENYVHRIGRTGRAGKGGHAHLILHPKETNFYATMLSDMPFTILQESQAIPHPQSVEMMERVVKEVDKKLIANTYRSWLGYYRAVTSKLKWSKNELAVQGNLLVKEMGLTTPPKIFESTAKAMGLLDVPALNIVPNMKKKQQQKKLQEEGSTREELVVEDEEHCSLSSRNSRDNNNNSSSSSSSVPFFDGRRGMEGRHRLTVRNRW